MVVALQVTQGAAEAEDLRRRLEVVETELKMMLEGSGGQKGKERPMEGSCQLEEGRVSEGNTVQSQHSGRKKCRGEGLIMFILFLLKLADGDIFLLEQIASV